MIQDIMPHQFDNGYRDILPDERSIALCFFQDSLLAYVDPEKGELFFPLCQDIGRDPFVYLFSVDGVSYFLYLKKEKKNVYSYLSMREIRELDLEENRDVFIAFSAYHLYRWYENEKRCGRCGARTEKGTKERSLVCPKCGNVIYPRINPAVIVGVINGDRILLTKYRRDFSHNALVAGFCEFGETLEETVKREVFEETGLKVKNIRYYKSQPWGIAQDILAGFYCDVDGDDEIRMDENELRYAQWVRRDDIILQPRPYSLTNEMMLRFKEGKEC